MFYGTLKVLDSSNVGLSAETIGLKGGSSKFDWHVEVGDMTAEMALAFSEYPDFVFELFAGNAPTSNSAEASGSVSTLTNKKGTSAQKADVGIASIAAKSGSETDLKFGKYVVKVVSATTVDVYYSSDADIGRGTNGTYQNDGLKITATALTIPDTGATVDVPSFGLTLTGGSGTVAMTAGDTATFQVRPPNSGSMDVVVGSQSDQNFPEFGAIVMAARRGNQEMAEIDALRCKAGGLPMGFTRNEWSKAEVTVKLMYDQELDGVYKIRTVKPTGT